MRIYVFEELANGCKVRWREHFATLGAAQKWAMVFTHSRYILSELESDESGLFDFSRVIEEHR